VRREVAEGTQLRNYGRDEYGGESWCEVSTLDYRTRGWARDRYLRPAYGAGHYPGHGSGTRGDLVEVYGVNNALTIASQPSKSSYVVGRVNAGTTLRREGCEMANGEEWCRVSTLDGRMHGWARERYLRSTGSDGGFNPGYGNPMMGSISGIQGMNAVRAIDELRARDSRTSIPSHRVARSTRSTTIARHGCAYRPPPTIAAFSTSATSAPIAVADRIRLAERSV